MLTLSNAPLRLVLARTVTEGFRAGANGHYYAGKSVLEELECGHVYSSYSFVLQVTRRRCWPCHIV